jgi:ketosteroid isomerase-like protein
MRKAFIALALAVLLHIPAAGQDKTAVMTTVQHFVDAFNKGDTNTATALCGEQTFIIDEFPPYEWRGAGGCAKWMAAYDADAQKNAITDGVVTLSSPRHVDIVGDRAYVVVPADYAFKQKEKAVKETASTLTIVLRKSVAGWRISAWSWSKN